MTARDRIDLMGCPIDAVTLEQAVARVERMLDSDGSHTQVSINAHKMMEHARSSNLRRLVADSALVTADGAGVVLAARALGRAVPERVTGIDLFGALMKRAAARGWRPYLLGATNEVLEEVAAHYRRTLPALEFAGMHHGYFGNDEQTAVAEDIRRAAPDLLFVGMPSPAKEQLIAAWAPTLNVPFLMGVGGSFDVVAGRVARAPHWLQRCHLEWAWRTLQEPRRLLGQPLRDSGRFAVRVARARLLGPVGQPR